LNPLGRLSWSVVEVGNHFLKNNNNIKKHHAFQLEQKGQPNNNNRGDERERERDEAEHL
jgi:hypothetical protein